MGVWSVDRPVLTRDGEEEEGAPLQMPTVLLEAMLWTLPCGALTACADTGRGGALSSGLAQGAVLHVLVKGNCSICRAGRSLGETSGGSTY